MADISKISPDGGTTEYNIKDSTARADVSTINGKIPSGASSSNKMATASDVAGCVDWSSYAVTGAVNLMPIPSSVVTQEKNQITYTITRNSGGQVTEIDANGTSNAAGALTLIDKQAFLGAGTYHLSGCDLGSTAYQLYVNAMNGSSFVKQLANTSTGVTEFTVDYNGYDSLSVGIYVDNNKTLDHVKFYPMVSTDANAPFAPYAMTNRELTNVAVGKWGSAKTIQLTTLASNGGLYLWENPSIHMAVLKWAGNSTAPASATTEEVNILSQMTEKPLMEYGVAMREGDRLTVNDTGKVTISVKTAAYSLATMTFPTAPKTS